MWFFVGVFVGVITVALVLLFRRQKIIVRWYEWLVGILGLLILLFGLQNFSTTLAEHWELDTSLTFLLVFALPGAVLVVIAGFLPLWRRHRGRYVNTGNGKK